MYTVMGATGKVGGSVAVELLRHGESVQVPVRDRSRAQPLGERGAQVVQADYECTDELAAALRAGPAGAFVMLPPQFDPSPGFPEARARIEVLHDALVQARPARVVALSTIGADAPQPNLLGQLRLLEQRLAALPCPVTFVRAAWFMDNAAFDLEAARTLGHIDSYLQPLERQIPMVAATDVGVTAAQLLREAWQGVRVVELEGPAPVSPLQVAQAFTAALSRPVRAVIVPRATWAARFAAQGMRNPEPRMQMLDGFNQGWIRFGEQAAQRRGGSTPLKTVIRQLAE